MKAAIVVLSTGEYWRGAKVLFHTLRKYGNLPSSVTTIAMGMKECDFAEAVPITQDYSWVPVSQVNFPRVAEKLFALTLDYDRIIMLDADTICLGDCSLLWSDWLNPLPFYAVRDVASNIYYNQVVAEQGLDPNLLFNAGTMIFDTRKFPLSNFLLSVRNREIVSYDGGDQGYLNCWFQKTKTPFGWLPLEYNACTDSHYPRMESGTEKIVHFTGANVKPWNTKIGESDRRYPLVVRWRQEWEDCNR
jgi:lipopolysaccharide biosynthesis glycosyltransferase